MHREWELEELIACWTLVDSDRARLANKAGATRLGFALLLKFFELEARFPRKADDQAFKARVRTVLHASYSRHYRRMLPRLLAALEFRCNNSAYRPVTDALVLLARYADRDRVRCYDPADHVPLDGVVPR